MLRIPDRLGNENITFHYLNDQEDYREYQEFIQSHSALGLDTESTGINCYRPGWRLRTFQIGNATDSYVVPARRKVLIGWTMEQPINWIGHNGPHDIRSIDQFLGYATGIRCAGETYIPSHHNDSRNQQEGGTGHGLKELAIAYVSRDAGKWETALKAEFKKITIPIPGEVYKSGKRKGEPKVRRARLDEGWSLIAPDNPAYIAYAAADPLLTYRVWKYYQRVVRAQYELYQFDHKIQTIADTLQRRAIKLDVPYTQRLSAAYLSRANKFIERANVYGCGNINSGAQIASTIQRLGETLTHRTPTGQFKTDDGVLRGLAERSPILAVKDFIGCVLGAKQLLKRRENYTEAMLREMDADGRIHPSINTLGARTTRMSVSNPPLQQLPTKDREDEA